MTLPDWIIQFLPDWEVAIRCTFAGVMATALWRAFCIPKKVARRWIALVSALFSAGFAVLYVWSRTRDPAQAVADALLIGAVAPGLWVLFMAAAKKWAPWIAEAMGEDMRLRPRNGEVWTDEKRRKVLFGDTDQISIEDVKREDVKHWRKEHSDG